jgi:hypothetical protein
MPLSITIIWGECCHGAFCREELRMGTQRSKKRFLQLSECTHLLMIIRNHSRISLAEFVILQLTVKPLYAVLIYLVYWTKTKRTRRSEDTDTVHMYMYTVTFVRVWAYNYEYNILNDITPGILRYYFLWHVFPPPQVYGRSVKSRVWMVLRDECPI